MKRIMTARIGGKYIIVPKLLGLLLVLVALLLFLGATIDLVVTWDKIKDVHFCLEGAKQAGDEMGYLICSVKALAAGVYPYSSGVDYMDVWGVMSVKAALWFFWVFLLVIALVIYQSGKIFELEEEVMEPVEETKERAEASAEKVMKEAEKTVKKARRTRKRRTTKTATK